MNEQSTPAPSTAALQADALDDIQGNILAGFRNDRQAFVFLRFPGGQQGRAWLADLQGSHGISTTSEVAAFNQRFIW
jgi:hypothetical protein